MTACGAIAISLVVAGHWAELYYSSEIARAFARVGRRIFFILSGYLITTLLMKEYGKNSTIRLRKLYARRAYRILPAALAFMSPVFVIFWHELAPVPGGSRHTVGCEFRFLLSVVSGHLWSISVQEQFYFLWLGVLKKWHRHRIPILLGAIAFAPLYRVACRFLGLHGRADETLPAVADILAIGCLLAIFEQRLPKSKLRWALLMISPVVLVPVYMGVLRIHTTTVLLVVLWSALHLSIAGRVLHLVQRTYWILNVPPVMGLGRISYGLYLWQQLFAFGQHPRPWYFVLFGLALAVASYYLLGPEQGGGCLRPAA